MTQYYRQHFGQNARFAGGGYTQYTAVGSGRPPQSNATEVGAIAYPYANIEVEHIPQTYGPHWTTGGNWWRDISGYDSSYIDHLVSRGHIQATQFYNAERRHYRFHTPEDRAELDEAKKDFEATPEGSPDTLFATYPESHVINAAFSDPSMRHHIPILGAMAHMDINADGGNRKLTASNDLSALSSALTRNAIKKGLPVETHELNPDAEVSNTFAFLPQETTSPELAGDQMPQEYVGKARAHLRTILRPTTPSTPVSIRPSRGKPPTLPGMEGFL